MYIRCKSCGQLLYIPDDENSQTVYCPACQSEFLYTPETTQSDVEKYFYGQSSKPIDQSYEFRHFSSQYEDLPETAERESYHQPKNLNLQPFSSWEAVLSAYRIIAERFGVMILLAILLTAPNYFIHVVQIHLVPNITELQKSLSEKETFDEVIQSYNAISKEVPAKKSVGLLVINVIFSLVNAFIFVGGIRLFNAYGRGQKASFWLTFSGFDSPSRVLLASFLIFILFLAVLVSAFVIFLAMSMAGLSFFAVCLIFILLTFFWVYMFFVFPLIADTNVSAAKAFQLSYDIAKRNISALFGTVSLLFLIYMLIDFSVFAMFGNLSSNIYASLIAQALFAPIMLGVTSVVYLKATGQFRR